MLGIGEVGAHAPEATTVAPPRPSVVLAISGYHRPTMRRLSELGWIAAALLLSACGRGCDAGDASDAGPAAASSASLSSPAPPDLPPRLCAEGPPLPAPRYAHRSVALHDRTSLLVGGRSAEHAAVAEVLRVREGATLRSAGRLVEARFGYASTLLIDGSAMILGGLGDGGALSSTEVYDGVRDAWSKGPPLTAPRAYATATTLFDGRVIVVGGAPSPEAPPHTSVEAWSRETGAFRAIAELQQGRSGHAAVMLTSGDTVLVGGVGAVPGAPLGTELFDVARSLVRPLPAAPVAWSPAFALLGRDGRALVFGRTSAGSLESMVLEPRSQLFAPTGLAPLAMPAVDDFAHVTTADGQLVVATGGVLFRRDLRLGRFVPTATLRQPRTAFALGAVGGDRVLVSGGRANGSGDVLATTELCDLSP